MSKQDCYWFKLTPKIFDDNMLSEAMELAVQSYVDQFWCPTTTWGLGCKMVDGAYFMFHGAIDGKNWQSYFLETIPILEQYVNTGKAPAKYKHLFCSSSMRPYNKENKPKERITTRPKRDIKFPLFLNREEHEKILEASIHHDMSMNAFIRKRTLEGL